jgi:hypothetical protein
MRRIHVIAIAALGVVFLALLAAQVVPAYLPYGTHASSPAMDIMQMMRDAKELPEQSYDAI